MARYKQRPEVVGTEQFTGGKDSADRIIHWLKLKGYPANWVDNQTVMDIHLQERVSFTQTFADQDYNMVYSAYKGDWIVEKNGRFRIFSAKEFNERFEKI